MSSESRFQVCGGGIQLKPVVGKRSKDSFGEFDKFVLDIQKVQEIIRKHHQTFLQLLVMQYCQ